MRSGSCSGSSNSEERKVQSGDSITCVSPNIRSTMCKSFVKLWNKNVTKTFYGYSVKIRYLILVWSFKELIVFL